MLEKKGGVVLEVFDETRNAKTISQTDSETCFQTSVPSAREKIIFESTHQFPARKPGSGAKTSFWRTHQFAANAFLTQKPISGAQTNFS